MTKRPTIADLAVAAGVSVSTVDRILNKRGVVQQSTILHVLNVARRLGFYAAPLLHSRLTENAPDATFGFLLNRRDRVLYARLGAMLEERTSRSELVRGKAVVHYLEDVSDEAAADALRMLARECNAIAGVMVDGPLVKAAIGDLFRQFVPVWTMLSDVQDTARIGFVGADAIKLGRGVGWFLHRLCPAAGRVALLIGSAGYDCHRGYKAGLQAHLLANGSQLQILPVQETQERDDVAAERVKRILATEPGVSAVVVAGGGMDGAMAAVRDAVKSSRIILVGTELSDSTDSGLKAGLIDAVLSHPAELVVERTVRAMERYAAFGDSDAPVLDHVPIEIRIGETV